MPLERFMLQIMATIAYARFSSGDTADPYAGLMPLSGVK